MRQDDDQFSQQDIDQWIEQLMQHETNDTGENHQDVQLVKILHHHYEKEYQQQKLQRAWETISQYYDATIGATETGSDRNAPHKKSKKNARQYQVHQTSKRRNFARWSTWLLVAVFIMVVGSFAVIINHTTQMKSTPEAPPPSMCTITSNATTPHTKVPSIAATSTSCIKTNTTVTPTVIPSKKPQPIASPKEKPKPALTSTAVPTSKLPPVVGK